VPEKSTTRSSSGLQDTDSFDHDRFPSHGDSASGDYSNAPTASPTAFARPPRLLVVDESDEVRQTCREAAERFRFVVIEADTIPAARKILERNNTAIVLLDLTRPEGEGRSVLAEIKSLCPGALLIGMSSSATIASAVATMQIGAFDYLSKPFPMHVLEKAFDRAAKRLCFEVERRKLREATKGSSRIGDVLGQSVEMEKLYRMLSTVGGSRHPVMIVGENGTGKELVARAIHSNGPDNSKPFVSIDCTSMSSESLETALFGTLDNASGEDGIERRGLLSAPEGGAVFLDEVGGLTLDLQAKLVRSLREKKIGPQGHPLSARILAATSHDLTQMTKEGRFRLDLFGVLSIVNLKIPPLRGRPDDITFLAERFLRRIGCGNGIVQTIPQETLRALQTYDWPENTTELESAISHACIRSAGAELEIYHLPQNILTFCRTKEAEQKRDLVSLENPANQTLEEGVIPMAIAEKRAILTALQQTNGDKRMAARLLGIGKTTLYRKLKEYSVDFEPESNLPLDPHLDSTPTAKISQMI